MGDKLDRNNPPNGQEPYTCYMCHGTGVYKSYYEGKREESECSTCHGNGFWFVPITYCNDCYYSGKGLVPMTRAGTEYVQTKVFASTPDDAYPGGYRTFDEVRSIPYEVFRCPHGHKQTDGY